MLKVIFRVFSISFLTICFSCSKESIQHNKDEVDQSSTKTSTVSTRLPSLKFEGGNIGKTTFSKNLSENGKNNNLFLSQFPLIEQKYEIEIQYDSIIEYEIDSISLDTISINTYIAEISRDTIGYSTGPKYMPFDDKNFENIYIGNIDTNDSTKIYFQWDEMEYFDPSVYGLLFRCAEQDTLSEGEVISGCWAGSSDIKDIDRLIYEQDSIPIYDDFGNVSEMVNGISINVNIRHFQVLEVEEITRNFRITIHQVTPTDSIAVSNDYTLKFVPKEIYEDRLCWLAGNPECIDKFEE
ncbi:MAG: hypothetical protein NXH90_04060 [Flavobacteriaceae bacterium]|nr:hypothetical protein [Flavobacteriaceae bacterium]